MNFIKINNKRGEGYIDAVVVIISCVLVIALALSVYPVFVAKSQINHFAEEIIREAELSGEIGDSVNKRIDYLQKELINVDNIIWDAEYIQGTKKIQLDGAIEVTIEKNVDIGFGEFGSFPIHLKAIDSGFSEVYWK